LTLLCVRASAQVSFKPFPVVDTSIASISADGSVVVGVYVRNPTQAFRWTAAEGIQNIGGDLDTVKVSRDGKTIAGADRDSQGIRNAAIWQSGTKWKLLGGVPGGAPQDKTLSAAYDVSGDGSVIVGIAYLGL
jgi:uncharacterized membrane protein